MLTYAQFHLIFILPVLLILFLVTWRDVRQGKPFSGRVDASSTYALGGIAALLAVALIYTTPWDNYLVFKEVWGYPPGRVLMTIGYVPIEEYAFFILQTLLTSTLFFVLARRVPAQAATTRVHAAWSTRVAGSVLFLLIAAAGLLALSTNAGTYVGLILIWGMPVLAFQWLFGGDLIVRSWRLVVPATLIPTVYLWVADTIAILDGIWWISPQLSSGLKLGPLPVEEALFFLLTNTFVTFGLSLYMHPDADARLQTIQERLKQARWWQGVFMLWLISMIVTPLLPAAFTQLTYLSTSLLAVTVLAYVLQQHGQASWALFLLAISYGWLIEWIGKTTGLPFGVYDYANKGPHVAGVPLFVPLGWWAFTMIAMTIAPAKYLTLITPLILVIWDLSLDPLMVTQGFWAFTPAGNYYGVPISNFIGWYVAGFILVALIQRISPTLKPHLMRAPQPMYLIFMIQAFLMSTGLLYYRMPIAAIITFISMSIIMYLRLTPAHPRVHTRP